MESKEFSTSNQYIKYKIIVDELSQNIANNSTKINVSVKFYRTNTGYETYGNGTVYCTINGVTYTSVVTSNQKITNSGIVLFNISLNIGHESNGTKNLSITSKISHSQFSSTNNTYTLALNSIPRATQPSLSVSNIELGQKLTISTPRASSSFTHNLYYKIGETTGLIARDITTSYVWSLPIDLSELIIDNTKASCEIICRTYESNNLIGVKSVKISVLIPESAVPSISSISVLESVESIKTKFKNYVQYKSKLNINIEASGIYGSKIKSYETKISNDVYSGKSFITNTIKQNCSVAIETTITDSRGRKATKIETINVLPYSKPRIFVFNANRSDSTGVEYEDGQNIKISYSFNIERLNDLNDKCYELAYKEKNTDVWNNIKSENIYSVTDGTLITDAIFNTDKAYDLRLKIKDYFYETSLIIDIPTSFTILDFNSSGKGIAFGKMSEKDCMEIALDVELKGKLIQEPLIIPTLLNNWVNYGGEYETVGFFKDSCGVIHIQGLIKDGVITSGTTVFTLPEGYRVKKRQIFITPTSKGMCYIYVMPNGNVNLGSGADATYTSLSGVTFKV